MPINVKITGDKSIEHLDPDSAQHINDYKWAKARRERKAEQKLLNSMTPSDGLPKLKCLGKGLRISRDGRFLTSQQFYQLVKESKKLRCKYKYWEQRGDGRTTCKKRKIQGVKNYAITMRPDIDAGVKSYDAFKDGKGGIRTKITNCAMLAAKEFEILTDYQVLAIAVHPNEGVLHFHLIYATVTLDQELLGDTTRSAGRRGIPNMGPRNLGLVRLASAGLRSAKEARVGYLDLKRIKTRSGSPPIDLMLAEMVDGFWDSAAFQDPLLRKHMDSGRAAYIQNRNLKLAAVGKNEFLTAKLREKEAQVGRLKTEIESLSASLKKTQQEVVKKHLKLSALRPARDRVKAPPR